jgi:hypothetical protein
MRRHDDRGMGSPRDRRRRFLQRHHHAGRADVGFLFHAPAKVIQEFPQFPAFEEYGELLAAMKGSWMGSNQ